MLDPHKNRHSFAILQHFSRFGLTPTLSSQALGWDGLFAMVVPYSGDLPPLTLPATVEEDEILVQLSDSIQLNVRIGDESFFTVGNPGSFSIAPNYASTTWRIMGCTQIFVISLQHELLTQIALEVLNVDPKYVKLAGKVGEEDQFLYQVSQLIIEEIGSQGLAGNLFISSLTRALAIHLLRKYTSFPQKFPHVRGKLSPNVLQLVLDFINESLEEDLTLERIANVANLSTFHFSRKFKQTMNIPVHQYVLEKRLEYAKNLLTGSELSISEIAAKAGFADASHFSHHFRKRFGVSPRFLTK